ncbi:MAG: 3-isopropylmalate dehydratase, small subunit [Verrucomicrobiaceae bacterium]|nr:3-isopropylmalate dehydratase, small subunit [Verrucomicrobiaceae bacterium]
MLKTGKSDSIRLYPTKKAGVRRPSTLHTRMHRISLASCPAPSCGYGVVPMALAKITQVSGRAVFIPGADIDTDRIIPARFMKCVTFDGLGEFAFYDVRKNEDGTDKPHPLNEERFKGASILVANSNFGCGSSREHAPQALYRYGFRAVIAESFAEIFFGNCTTLGIPCVIATTEDVKDLAAAINADPTIEVGVDLVNERVTYGDKSIPVTSTASARDALITGHWDAIAELLEGKEAVDAKMKELGWA